MNYLKNLWKSKSNESPINDTKDGHIRMNIKGQQIVDQKTFNQFTYKYSNHAKEGPRMLNTKTRAKVWGHVGFFFLYCYVTYKLLRYRLKADDLDLMEREVKNEYEIRRKVKELDKDQ
jgi:hypothetical protein